MGQASDKSCSRAKIKLAIATLGCKTNLFESAVIAQSFDDYELVDFHQDADIYVINTCTVTNRTDYKSRNLIRKALAKKEINPQAIVVVTGCYAQRSEEEILELGEVDYVVDNQAKLDIAQIVCTHQNHFQDIMEAREFAFKPARNMLEHTRAFQKIQDGCDFYCNYCAIPYARGHSRSARFEDVILQANLFAQEGFKEIVLGGINVGLYRDGKRDLADVVEGIAQIEQIKLVRISSIEPQLLIGDLLPRIMRADKLAPHFHIPLQSGCDAVLRAMGRRYDRNLVAELVAQIKEQFPLAAIGFDLICGYPGEDQALFEDSYKFLAGLPIAYLHVFPYSIRKGTLAAKDKNQVPNAVKNQRSKLLTALSSQKKSDYARLLFQEKALLSGVIEISDENGSEFLSDHYLRLRVPQRFEQGEWVQIELDESLGHRFILD
ncbi:MAG: tRNA (N(6)-L-threonylcarbamoyladenosine(37)-C(2))-methylthiotransferase MtaB [Candidatus Cloacimonetes bacterium]|jgi:threonylcarbamoyladenosine tRNA methylthiotransferase MtaB|nr:tRNA (N(6)-L-threonylcarbamoyladenosine(37)-C(2))-methylthiotransferase MtaB [Candidatus Cloacimonadota bacterium]NLO43733.1 tRNA (N(6)-L-threonylcarbamoyladenosine(37)-C(2))-methylthiotransferase MtaB [Candidatus Cloacimonadota bacterium]